MSAFRPGDRVRVRATQPMFHTRIPAYVAGQVGEIERVLRPFVIPEDDAYGRLRGGRTRMLYRVRFHQADTWSDYRGSSDDCHEIELFEHYLEAEPEETR